MPSLFSSKDKISVMNALKINDWSGEWTANRKGISIRLAATRLADRKTVDYSFDIETFRFNGVANTVTEALSVIERSARKGPAEINEVFLTKTVIEKPKPEPKPEKTAKPVKKAPAKKAAAPKSESKAETETAPAPAKRKTKKTEAVAAADIRSKFSPDAKIKILVDENPKREGGEAHKRFALYRNGMTVNEALEAGVLRMDLSWDTRHSFIAIQ